jgi:hypothetical protein
VTDLDVEALADRLARLPGVVAVTLGGSRAAGEATPESDWDFGLYYRGTIDPADVVALGGRGEVFAPGAWGPIVNGGAWLEIDGAKVDLIYRDLDDVAFWVAEAEAGRFRIDREVGYVAGIATYVLAGELALAKVLRGDLPRPVFPDALRSSAPPSWINIAAGALHVAGGAAGRDDRVACLANVTLAVLAAAQARLARRGVWALNEKRLVERAGLGRAAEVLRDATDLGRIVEETRPILALDDPDSPWLRLG